MESSNRSNVPEQGASSGLALAVAWLFVGVPLAWGVTQTFIKALALFK